jgi:DNA modification methylase
MNEASDAGTPPVRLVEADWLEALGSRAGELGIAEITPGGVDLVYADPPFNTGRPLRGSAGAFGDAWGNLDGYCDWLAPRLAAAREALRPTGSILVHVDWRTSHRVRVLLDEIFGPRQFVNHIVWHYGLGGSSPKRFARKHDDILFYARDVERYFFDPPLVPATSRRLKGRLKKATDVLDIPAINNMARERTGWPTQKPVALLDVLVRACCPSGGIVLDPCCGSGTTLIAAMHAGRRAVGVDAATEAIELARSRLAAAGAAV